jgi:serine/threonine protein kinase
MANLGNRTGGVDPEAATLSVPDHQTLVDKKAKQYSSTARSVRPVEVGGLDLAREDFSHRYRPGRKLGEGSMGEVIVTRDMRILRDVAMKRLHQEHHELRPDLRDRFLREARVQGQLEHPSVVPIS